MIRLCKACGQGFEPKGREQYCPGPHYLPCPVCGNQVEIKYWTDGPKRCPDCRKSNAKIVPASAVSFIQEEEKKEEPKTSIEEMTSGLLESEETRSVDISDSNVRRYIGAPRKDCFIPGHLYLLNIEKEVKYGCYIVTSTSDVTSGEDVSLYMRYSNMKTVERNFEQVTE